MPGLPLKPETASTFAARYDALFAALTVLSVLFAGGVIAMAIYWAVRYREGSPVPRKRPEHENLHLEAVLIGVPLVLGIGMFVWGARLYIDERTPPRNATEIFVMGKQWMWHLQHPNGIREMNALTVPVNKPVRLTMISQDVIHAFYVPAFRVQFQVLPGRYTQMWFTPTKPGRYLLLCNMYCGTDHSRMVGHVDVLEPRDYQKWLAQNERPGRGLVPTLLQSGRSLFVGKKCGSCHGAEDSAMGPSLIDLYGKRRRLADGSAVTVDDDYLRNAILNPEYQIAAGYQNSMPHYPDLTEGDVWALVTYLKSLKGAKP